MKNLPTELMKSLPEYRSYRTFITESEGVLFGFFPGFGKAIPSGREGSGILLRIALDGFLACLCTGRSSCTETPKTSANFVSSKSPTQRVRHSMRAMISRDTSHPASWHFAASCGCDQERLFLIRRTCGPEILRAFLPV